MIWSKIKQTDFVRDLITNPYKSKHQLGLNCRPCPSPEEDRENDYYEYILVHFRGIVTVDILKKILTDLVKEYDKSDNVNSLIIDNHKTWYTKEQRISIVNAIRIAEQLGQETFILWIHSDDKVYKKELTIADAKHLFDEIELYTIQCNDVTQQHLIDIQNLDNLDDCFNFKITDDYPNYINL